MIAKRYRPSFMEGFPEESAQFTSLKDLLEIPWVAQWTSVPSFYRFSLDSDIYLMAELKEGKEWWVIALLDGPVEGLPKLKL